MARMPRWVVPDYPHRVTQRGNRRMKTFFCDDDYRAYLYSDWLRQRLMLVCHMGLLPDAKSRAPEFPTGRRCLTATPHSPARCSTGYCTMHM
jgi:hypothetical protein